MPGNNLTFTVSARDGARDRKSAPPAFSLTRSMLWQPACRTPSQFLQHAPFAFWLAEAMKPACFVALGQSATAAQLAVCQAVQQLDLETRCFGVSLVAGDADPDPRVERNDADAERLESHHRHYGAFSRMITGSCQPLQSALRHFRAAEIDWLHIDEPAILASLQQHWSAWHSLLSPSAVMTIHGTALREPQAASGFLADLQRRYPSVEFIHGDGLTLLCIGARRNRNVDQLVRGFAAAPMRQTLRSVFARLGQACVGACESGPAREVGRNDPHKQLEHEVAQRLEPQLTRHQQETGQMNLRLTQTEAALSEAQTQLQAARDKAASEAARADRLDAACKVAQQAQQAAEQRLAEAQAASAAAADDAKRVTALQAELKQVQATMQQQARRLDDRFRELGTLTAMIEEKDKELALLRQRSRVSGAPVVPAAPEVLTPAAQLELVARSGLFDSDWYLATYPDVSGQRGSALQHFMRYGAAEMRNPSATFDTGWYCRTYRDVIASGLNPLLHYIRIGRKEGRATCGQPAKVAQRPVARTERKRERVHG